MRETFAEFVRVSKVGEVATGKTIIRFDQRLDNLLVDLVADVDERLRKEDYARIARRVRLSRSTSKVSRFRRRATFHTSHRRSHRM